MILSLPRRSCHPLNTFHSPFHTDLWQTETILSQTQGRIGTDPGYYSLDLEQILGIIGWICATIAWIWFYSYKQYRQSKSRSSFLNWRRLPLWNCDPIPCLLPESALASPRITGRLYVSIMTEIEHNIFKMIGPHLRPLTSALWVNEGF